VDRIFALWQALYPDLFIPAEGLEDDYGTYTIAPGTTEYSTDPLTPFTSSTTGAMYTSDSSRDLKPWGYTYPEFSDWNQTKAQLSATVRTKINALYNPSGAYSRRKRHARDLSSSQQYEWFVNIEVSKSELQSSSMVLLFNGAPPTDTTTWRGASNLIGSLFVPMPPNHSMGSEMRYTHGELPLKEALAKGGLSDSSKEAVITYLTNNLEWRVQSVSIFLSPKT
jgi:tyrosinase